MEDKTVEKIAERSYEKGFKDGVKDYKERLEKGVKNRPDKTCRFDEDGCNFGGSCYECAYAEILKLIQERK